MTPLARRKAIPIVAAILIIAAWSSSCSWNEKRQIRRRLDALGEAASIPSTASQGERLARAGRLGNFFTEDVMIRRDVSAFVGGRQAVTGLALEGAKMYDGMQVAFRDVQVSVSGSSTATVLATLTVSPGRPQAGSVEPRQVNATFTKINGEWMISGAEVLRTLDAPNP